MLSYFSGYLQTNEVRSLLAEKLRQVNDDPNSRFCTLKKRFRQHYELLQMEKGFGDETVQRMIDILGTHGDYRMELGQVVESSAGESRSEKPSRLSMIVGFILRKPTPKQPSKTTLNGYKLAQKDDTTFLTEICAIIREEPAYQRIVEEILQEATNSLSTKLEVLKKELLPLVEKEIRRTTTKEIKNRTSAERRDADVEAQTQLRSLIRQALDAEADHPTSR